VLSEVPEAWAEAVGAWREMNTPLSPIHPADEYALYQSLVGAWPPELAPDDETGVLTLRDRLEGWLIKALREAKERSDWNDPDHEYEGRAKSFLRGALRPACPFVATLSDFVRGIEPAAAANGLAQLLVKLTAPGIPDIYQGTETIDLSLVDPDNRRPVDFAALASALEREPSAKMRVLQRALALRARHPDLFARGRYHPLAVEGELARHVLAFGRVLGKRLSITVIGRHLGQRLLSAENVVLPSQSWANTAIILPRSWRALPLRDPLCDVEISVNDGRLLLAPFLSRSPVALLSTG
jgi:maltooligosyltrehalose synthase